jgi:UDP-2,3-diacylglucosamine hydrolase
MTAGAAPDLREAARAAEAASTRIGIVAGGGSLPLALAEAAEKRGGRPFIIGLKGNASAAIERFPHAYVGIGQVGFVLRTLRREGCKRIVFVGSLKRPNLFRLKLDTGFFLHLPQLLRLFKGGDDTVLRGVARFFEGCGFEVVAAHEIAPRLLAPAGAFSAKSPDAEALDDIKLGFKVARSLGVFDIGQGAVVARQYVLAVEAAEGTDAMLRRCRDLNKWGFHGRKGALVKTPKPGQDLRLDLPAIGPRTVELAAEAGLAGIAVAAGAVLLAEQQELVEKADKLGLFLYGASSAELLDS